MPVDLTPEDRSVLEGAAGEGARLAMRILVEVADLMQAPRLIDVTGAHVDGCLYHGRAGLEFAERLAAGRARVAIPTTLNVSSLDLLHPGLVPVDAGMTEDARRLMDAYVAMGCRPTWTCAPYQSPVRPGFGEHVAWAESNAIVFANSVLGARTNRYGDFIDICAAITGRAPLSGLHTDDGRRARAVFRIGDVPDRLLHDDVLGAVLGHVVGTRTGSLVPAIVGLLPDASEDLLKALGAAAASSGAVGMFHAVGRTPEAPTLRVALAGTEPTLEVVVTAADLRAARDALTTQSDGSIGAVSLGTPHASLAELERIGRLIADQSPRVPIFVNAGRDVLAEAERRDLLNALTSAGVVIVADTCTYLVPIIRDVIGPVMTDSAKWAWYAPANLGFETVLGSLEECLRSAAAGRVVRDADLWADP